MYLNKVFLIGNLTRDPELKALPSGTKVATFGLATNRVYKDKNGNRQESAEFHNIVVFARMAETVSQYMKKGSQVYVEGRIQTRSWDSKEGEKKYRTEIVAENIQFGNRPAGASASSGSGSATKPAEKDETTAGAPSETIDYPSEEINPEDIPF